MDKDQNIGRIVVFGTRGFRLDNEIYNDANIEEYKYVEYSADPNYKLEDLQGGIMAETEWTLESILELLTPIFPDVICGEDYNGQFTIWTGFYKDGKPEIKPIVIAVPKDQIKDGIFDISEWDFRT